MTQDLLNLQMTEQAKVALSSLGPKDRGLVKAWFDHLRNWRNDDYIRSRSRRVELPDEAYVFETSTDLAIAFKITGDAVIVLSIFRAETLRKFEAASGRRAP